MQTLGHNCYCYNEDCNQQEWERLGKTGKRQWTVVSEMWITCKALGKWPVPKCPYCKKKMTVTANFNDNNY